MIIAIEGIDGAGKATQSKMLADALGYDMVSFPDYGTDIGKMIKKYLKANQKKKKISNPDIMCLLQAANKFEVLDKNNNNVHGGFAGNNNNLVLNRYVDSNVVYGLCQGLSLDWLLHLNEGLPAADLTILLDVPVEKSFKRRTVRRDAFEKNREFLEAVRIEYLLYAQQHEHKWIIIEDKDSEKPNIIHGKIMEKIQDFF